MSNRNRFLFLSNHACKSKKEQWRSDNFRDSNQEKKQRTDTVNEAKKSKTLQGAIEKCPILQSQYWKIN